jgi:hypothetical protein
VFESVGDKSPDEIIEHLVSVGEEWADGRERERLPVGYYGAIFWE